MKKILSSLVLASAFLLSSTASAVPASAESIKALMQTTGSGDIGMQMMNQMIPTLKKMVPNAPDTFWVQMMEEINADEMENLIIPVYQKYLSEEDIQAINKFNQSPSGKKLIKVQPAIMQESFTIGQQWGQNIAKEVLTKYQEQLKNKK